jgi:hypothetical protein
MLKVYFRWAPKGETTMATRQNCWNFKTARELEGKAFELGACPAAEEPHLTG